MFRFIFQASTVSDFHLIGFTKLLCNKFGAWIWLNDIVISSENSRCYRRGCRCRRRKTTNPSRTIHWWTTLTAYIKMRFNFNRMKKKWDTFLEFIAWSQQQQQQSRRCQKPNNNYKPMKMVLFIEMKRYKIENLQQKI